MKLEEIKNKTKEATDYLVHEAVPNKGVPRHRDGARSEALEGRVGFGCPSAEVGKENAQLH